MASKKVLIIDDVVSGCCYFISFYFFLFGAWVAKIPKRHWPNYKHLVSVKLYEFNTIGDNTFQLAGGDPMPEGRLVRNIFVM